MGNLGYRLPCSCFSKCIKKYVKLLVDIPYRNRADLPQKGLEQACLHQNMIL